MTAQDAFWTAALVVLLVVVAPTLLILGTVLVAHVAFWLEDLWWSKRP